MQVSLTATGGLERRLEVAVPATEVASEVEQRLKQISRTARLKGFRPGKAPFTVVRKQFGDQVHAEVVSDLMRSSFAQALTQEKLTPAASPRIEPIAMGPGADLKYAAVFEVMPEIKVKPVEGIAVERPSASGHRGRYRRDDREHAAPAAGFTAVERAGAGHRSRDDRLSRAASTASRSRAARATRFSVIIGSRQSMAELEEGLEGRHCGRDPDGHRDFPGGTPEQGACRQDGRAASHHKAGWRSSVFRQWTRNSAARTVSKKVVSRRCGPRSARAWSASWRM